eukprot:2708419-Pyramimonas_sp.AAC.1
MAQVEELRRAAERKTEPLRNRALELEYKMNMQVRYTCVTPTCMVRFTCVAPTCMARRACVTPRAGVRADVQMCYTCVTPRAGVRPDTTRCVTHVSPLGLESNLTQPDVLHMCHLVGLESNLTHQPDVLHMCNP